VRFSINSTTSSNDDFALSSATMRRNSI